MQASDGKTKPKKSKLPRVIFIILLLLVGGCACAWFMIGKPFAPAPPEFSSIGADAAGNNLTGNLDENLAAGGFMAGQNGWVYYANFEDNATLYMCREGGYSMVKLTDFPVANINIIGDSLVFTGLEQIFTSNASGISKLDFASPRELLSKIQAASDVWYGGALYAIYGITSTGNELRFASLEEAAYFPQLDKTGLYISSGKSNIANKLINATSRVGEPEELVVKLFTHGDTIYAELRAATGSRIARINAKTLQPLDSMPGKNLHRLNGGFVFQDVNNGYIYEIDAAGNQITPISAVYATDMRLLQNGDIVSRSANGTDILLSKRLYYIDVVSRALALVKRLTLQNGWYNYINADSTLTGYAYYPGVFAANGEYFSIGTEGIWLQNGVVVEWLRTQPLVAVATKDMFVPESGFTPSWYDSGAQVAESGNPGSEAGDNLSASKPSATADPRNALEAVIMLLRGDGALYEKYSPESVTALKSYYGDSLDKAIESAAKEFSSTIGTNVGAAPSSETLTGIVSVWFKDAKYTVGEAEINGDSALVALSTSDIVDSALLYPAAEAEVMARAKKNPMLLFKSKEQQAAWALDVLLEILENPKAYNILNYDSLENDVPMVVHILQDAPGTGWFVENPEVLLRCFVRGI